MLSTAQNATVDSSEPGGGDMPRLPRQSTARRSQFSRPTSDLCARNNPQSILTKAIATCVSSQLLLAPSNRSTRPAHFGFFPHLTQTSDSGKIEECKVLKLYDRAKDGDCRKTPDINEVSVHCLSKASRSAELTNSLTFSHCTCFPNLAQHLQVVTGTLPKLPGCNTITTKTTAPASTCASPLPAFFSKPVVYKGKYAPPGSQVTTK